MDGRQVFSNKRKQASGLISQRRANRSYSVGSRKKEFSDSGSSALTRVRKKFINTGSFSTIATNLNNSSFQQTPAVDGDGPRDDSFCETRQSQVVDEGRDKTKCERDKYDPSTHSAQQGNLSSTTRPNPTDKWFYLVSDQSTESNQAALEYFPMGSLLRNSTRRGQAQSECHCHGDTKSLQKAQTIDCRLPEPANHTAPEERHCTHVRACPNCSSLPNHSRSTENSSVNDARQGQLNLGSQVNSGNSICQVSKSIPNDSNDQTSETQLQAAGQNADSNDSVSHTRRRELQTQRSEPSMASSFRRQINKCKSYAGETLQSRREAGTTQEDSSDDDDDFHSTISFQDKRSEPCTPTSPQTEPTETTDPYQVFEVQHSPCLILTVRVLQGRNITLGFQDLYDIPDPYINLVMRSSPEGRKSTTVKEDEPNPVWNETFTFFINFTQANVLEISLMESNSYWFDQLVGTVYYDIVNIRDMDKPQTETFVFNDISEVDIEFKLEFDRHPTLRYSLCLSHQEKTFIRKRKKHIFEAMRKLLGDEDGPQNIEEVPTIAVIGSGGGFRAMTGYSGVFKALVESGVLGCAMYACGLSGSSWLVSTLYSHPKWPNLDMGEFLDELKHCIDKSLLRFLNASTMYNYVKFMIEKRREGQPVSFTDIFGRMVGETLLADRMETTLTDQREKIKDGAVPLPLYTCVHVKKDVPARSFQEWVEFSPYEIGMPKYGTFMDAKLFGSKFFMGKLVKQFKEQPLHFLQGIWGSAFCILFRRLLEENHHIDPTDMVREAMGDRLDEGSDSSSSDCSDDEFDDCSMDSTESLDSESCTGQNPRKARVVQKDIATNVNVPWSIYQLWKPQSGDVNCVETSQDVAETPQDVVEVLEDVAEILDVVEQKSQDVSETSQDVAETSQDVAETSQDVAETSQDVAETSQDVAETSQDVAEASQNFAETSHNIPEKAHNIDCLNETVSSPLCEVDMEVNSDLESVENGNEITVNDSIDTSSSCDADVEDDEDDCGDDEEERDLHYEQVIVEGTNESVEATDVTSERILVEGSSETMESTDVTGERVLVDGPSKTMESTDVTREHILVEESSQTAESTNINSQKLMRKANEETKEETRLQQSTGHDGCQESDSFQGLAKPSESTSSPKGLNEKSLSTEDGVDLSSDCKKRVNWGSCPTMEAKDRRKAYISGVSVRKSKSGSRSFWKQFLKGILESNSWELLSTRRGRAAVIHNFMRGLSLQQSYPLSPFTPIDERVVPGDEFDGIFEMHPTSVKHIYMVDAGLAFNSPYPLILRPQRAVDIILSFDFSARPSDNDPPFKELLLAEKWARLNRLPFPPIHTSVFDKEDVKELYIFRHPTDISCPIVFHFVLVNRKFKLYKKPEIPRETKEEFDFAEFQLFDDPKAPYSTFNFTYTHSDFERLSQLTEFNTLLHIGEIKEVIKEVIKNKREAPPKLPVQPSDIEKLRMKEQLKMQQFMSQMENKNSAHTGSHPSTPFCTPAPLIDTLTNPFFSQSENNMSQNPSKDGSSFNSKRDLRMECFCRNICRKKNLHPAIVYKPGRYIDGLVAKKETMRNSNLPPNSPDFGSIQSIPSVSAEHAFQDQEVDPSYEVDSAVIQKERFCETLNEEKSVTLSESTTLDHEFNSSCEDIPEDTKETTTASHSSSETASDSDDQQNTGKKPLNSPKLKSAGTEFTPSETFDQTGISSGSGSLASKTDISLDVKSNSEVNGDSLDVHPLETNAFSIDKTISEINMEKLYEESSKTDSCSFDKTTNCEMNMEGLDKDFSKIDSFSIDKTTNSQMNTEKLDKDSSKTDPLAINKTTKCEMNMEKLDKDSSRNDTFSVDKTTNSEMNMEKLDKDSSKIDTFSNDKTTNCEMNTESFNKNSIETNNLFTGKPNSANLNSDSTNGTFKTKVKSKKDNPPNPFFAKAYFMRSPHNSASSKSSCEIVDDTNTTTCDHTDNQTDSTVHQSTDSVQMTEAPKLAGRLSSRVSRPSPLIITSNNKTFSSDAQSSSSSSCETSPEIFTLAPEAFKADGTPVFDRQEAKMFYESVKNKRKLFRRQSKVNSLNSISLNECEHFCGETYTSKQHG